MSFERKFHRFVLWFCALCYALFAVLAVVGVGPWWFRCVLFVGNSIGLLATLRKALHAS